MTDETPTEPPTFGRWQQPAASTNSEDLYPLEDILFCATCDQRFSGAHQDSGVRVYRTACTCRPEPLLASEVEKRVYAETHTLAFGTDPVTDLTAVHYARLAIRFFTRIELGPTPDDITVTTRI